MFKIVRLLILSFISIVMIMMMLPSCLVQKSNNKNISVDSITVATLPVRADVDTEFYTQIEKPASFKNGDINTFLTTFLKKNTKYPVNALKKRQQGTVIVQFGVDCYGSLKIFSVLKSSGVKVLDDEALRALKSSPKWTPALLGNKSVGQIFILQIKFNAKTRGVEFK